MKILKWVLALVLVLAACAVGAGAVFFFVLHPKSRPAPDVTAPRSAEAVARGDYLANHVAGCTVCHSPVDETRPGDVVRTDKLGAGREFLFEGFPGRLRAPNISSDPKLGIGAWTDGEVLRAMREGVGKSGRTLFPMMPYGVYGRRLDDEDALAIIAYLRTLPPQPVPSGVTELDFPVSMFVRLAPRPLDAPPPAPPPASDPVARGQWLLDLASCAECHSQAEKGRVVPGLRMAGNTSPFKLPGGITVYAPNLTSDAATGIGSYSDADLMRVLTDGIGKNGKPLYVMPWDALRGMTEEDRRCLIAGLRQLPPVTHVVPASVKP
jgi:mono/diheme cytochrome c family protein